MSGFIAGRKITKVALLLLANLGLLALFLWAMAETVTLTVEVADGVCTAVMAGRSSSTPCPGLEGGQAGLYVVTGDVQPLTASNPWRLIIPDASWRDLSLASLDGSGEVPLLKAGRPVEAAVQMGEWRTAAGELQPLSSHAAFQWSYPLPDKFRLEAGLRRPAGNAGLLLLQPDGDGGWLFLYDSDARLGVWWRWQKGQPAVQLEGAPLQKSLPAQTQSLLRAVLIGHQAGLLLILASWLLAMALAWAFRRGRMRRKTPADQPTAAMPSVQCRGPTRDRIILIGLILWTFAWSMFAAGDLLGGVPHVQDSITYRFQAQTLARGRLSAPEPPEPDAFEQEFMLVKDGRWFGKYPPGYPLLLVIGELAGLPWLVNPLLATLTVALLFTLGRMWYGRRVALLAAGLAAVSPFFLIMSGTFMAHPAELFWVALFMVAWTRVLRGAGLPSRERLLWLASAGAAAGMIFLTRQLTALAIAGPFLLATTVIHPGRAPWSRRARDLLALAICAAPFAFLLLLYQGAVTGDPFQDPRLLFWSYDHLGFGQDIGQGQNVVTFDTVQGEQILIWQHDPDQPPRGHTLGRGIFNVERNWRFLQGRLFGWLPVFTLSFAWLVFVLGRARRADWIFLLTTLALPIAYLFYWADGISYGPRYFYAALPGLLLLVARGIQVSADLIGGRAGRWAIGLILAAFIAGGLLIYFPNVLEELEAYDFIDGAKVAAVEATVDEEALIFISGRNGDWWEYGNYFTGNTPWLDGRIIYARDLGPEANARLSANYPERAIYYLENGQLLRMADTGRP